MILTVAELKASIAAITPKYDAMFIELSDGPVSIFADVYVAKNGGQFRTHVAEIDLGSAKLAEAVYVAQDYSKLFLPDGSKNPAAFNADGTIKPGATDAVVKVG